MKGDIERCLLSRMDGYVSKPEIGFGWRLNLDRFTIQFQNGTREARPMKPIASSQERQPRFALPLQL
jgi:hypothetical protein